MKITFTNFTIGCMFLSLKCPATPKEEAIRSFVGSVINEYSEQSEFPDPSQFPAPLPPKGGYLTQKEIDLTQDSIPELFLSSSISERMKVYDISTSPPRLLVENMMIGHDFGIIKDDNSLTLISYYGTTRHNIGFVRKIYKFQRSGDYTVEDQKISVEDYDEISGKVDESANDGAGNFEELMIGTDQILHFTKGSQILLADYMNNPNAAWHSMHFVDGYGLMLERMVEFSREGGSGYEDPLLEDDRKQAANFSLSVARNWLKNNSQQNDKKSIDLKKLPTTDAINNIDKRDALTPEDSSVVRNTDNIIKKITILLVVFTILCWLTWKIRPKRKV